MAPKHVTRGGSFLCYRNYYESYRPAARRGTSPDTGMSHIGFRCARNTCGLLWCLQVCTMRHVIFCCSLSFFVVVSAGQTWLRNIGCICLPEVLHEGPIGAG